MILTYDVNVKRVAKTMKICRKYLTHVQKSVFEGIITEGKLGKLKYELGHTIIDNEDSIRIYMIDNIKYTKKVELGVVTDKENIL